MGTVAGEGLRIVIGGSSGFLGTALVPRLRAAGHEVVRLVRRAPRAADEVAWDPEAGQLDPGVLEATDAVVHLGGVGIGERRWTAQQKRLIRSSRLDSTRLLAEAVAKADPAPALVVASAVGYYGDRGDEVLTEASEPGDTFLSRVCIDWEAAADPARDAGARVVHVRTGIVLDRSGGALAKMLPLFRLGLGGRMGSGKQWWSWIGLDDLLGIYRFAVEHDSTEGPLNATAPNPVRNAELTRELAAALGRPALLPVPAFGPKLLLGEMAEELLFTSARVLPQATRDAGYTFALPDLGPCLHAALAA